MYGKWAAWRTLGLAALLCLGGCASANGGESASPSAASPSAVSPSGEAPANPTVGASGSGKSPGKTVPLDFVPVLVVPLNEVKVSDDALYRRIDKVTASGRDVEVRLLQDAEAPNDIHAYLWDDGHAYDIGLVGSYGMEGVQEPRASDVTGDGAEELLVVGAMGASYEELKVLHYEATSGKWSNVLTMGTPAIVDLDGDGRDDLVAVSAGSLPSYLQIGRWNEGRFELADAATALGSADVRLVRADGEPRIQSGPEGEPGGRLYRYAGGELIPSEES